MCIAADFGGAASTKNGRLSLASNWACRPHMHVCVHAPSPRGCCGCCAAVAVRTCGLGLHGRRPCRCQGTQICWPLRWCAPLQLDAWLETGLVVLTVLNEGRSVKSLPFKTHSPSTPSQKQGDGLCAAGKQARQGFSAGTTHAHCICPALRASANCQQRGELQSRGAVWGGRWGFNC